MLSLTVPSCSPFLLILPKTLTSTAHLSLPPKTLTLKTLTRHRRSHPRPSVASSAGTTSDELLERDFSFLEPPYDAAAADVQSRAIASAEVGAGSRVLLSFPTVGFAGRVTGSAPCELVVAVHESLLVLAMIKEADDEVRCFQGGIAVVPEKFFPFDAVFVCYFPALGVSVGELLGSVAARCSPGARLVISFDQGRKVIEQEHRQQYPDLVKFDLPDRAALEEAANDHSFQITEFVDEPTFYLVVLKFHRSGT
ncbi:uncharacterized protein M6B38_415630 [Iris pallida]|uniref:Uncharacterized protein n=1 Tax=Iris pallida TaxID=29817 RepID=A0AAX6FK42_IRIPA|nr:uncharacterized protein M6B38_415630 [Iris pallida]